jgi:hypothetical protein
MDAGMFSPSHLGRWEKLYRDLTEGHRLPLTPESAWMLADRPGLIAVFDEDEAVYISGAQSIAAAVQGFLGGKPTRSGPKRSARPDASGPEFRTAVAMTELGVSPKTAVARSAAGPTAERVNRRIARMSFRVVPAPAALLGALAGAFAVVSDPRYNGPTSRANRALDALPE